MFFLNKHSIIFLIIILSIFQTGCSLYGPNIKILMINPEDCSTKTVELQYPRDCQTFLKARNENGEYFASVLKDGLGFITETISIDRKSMIITKYSSDGSFDEQRNITKDSFRHCQFIGTRNAYGDTMIYEQEIVGQTEGRYNLECVIVVDSDTGKERKILSGGMGYEIYGCNPFNDLVIINETILNKKSDNCIDGSIFDYDVIENYYWYNLQTEQITPIQLPEYFEPYGKIVIDMHRKAFGLYGIYQNNGKTTPAIIDVSFDGKITDISKINYCDSKNRYLKTRDSDEYVLYYEKKEPMHSNLPFIAHNELQGFLSRYSLKNGEINKVQIKQNNKKNGLIVNFTYAFATKNRLGVFVEYEGVSCFGHLFPTYEYVIYDRDWNILKSVTIPSKWSHYEFDGEYFYVSYY